MEDPKTIVRTQRRTKKEARWFLIKKNIIIIAYQRTRIQIAISIVIVSLFTSMLLAKKHASRYPVLGSVTKHAPRV